jgi:hypothetical protein
MSESAAPAAATTTANAPAESSTPQDNAAPKQEAKAKPAKQIIDLDGEKLDLEQLKRERQKWKGADQRFREAAEMRETAAQREARLLENPAEFLSDPQLAPKMREWAEKILLKQLEDSLGGPVDPRDAEVQKLKDQLKEFQDAAQAREQEEQQRQYQAAVEERKNAIGQTLSKALEATPFHAIPELRAEALAEMAKYMRILRKAGHEATPDELAAHVKDMRLKSFMSLVNGLEGQSLVDVLGEDLVKRLRKYDLEQLRAKRQQKPPEVAEEWSREKPQQEKREFVDPWKLRGR